jgi:CRP-like cAMP-binding protein
MLDREITFKKDTYIIHQGDYDCSLYVIEKGTVRLVPSVDS